MSVPCLSVRGRGYRDHDELARSIILGCQRCASNLAGRQLKRGSSILASCCCHLLALIVAFFIAIAPAPPVAAKEAAATQIECEKAGMTWRPNIGKCSHIGQHRLSAIEQALGILGLACAILALWLLWRTSEQKWDK
jgi:hypothetical protein